MREVADGVWQLFGYLPHVINYYLVTRPKATSSSTPARAGRPACCCASCAAGSWRWSP